MRLHELTKQFHDWTATFWPEDRAERIQSTMDRLCRLSRQRFEALVRRRMVIDRLREHVAPSDGQLQQHEQAYRQRLAELVQIKRRLARLRQRA